MGVGEPTRLIAIRHGETAWNAETRLQGQIDIPLNALGQRQAASLSGALRDEGLQVVYASDLGRAWQTAQALAGPLGLPLQADAGLRERGFGQLEGHTYAEIDAQWPELARRWRTREPGWAPPGGESLLVFADRNRVEKEETFEIPSAARDRFIMELHIETPADLNMQRQLMFDPKFHDVDRLIDSIRPGILPYAQINDIGRAIQHEVQASQTLQDYALSLWQATRQPKQFGVKLDGVDMDRLILAGASARGMSLMMRAARVQAWLSGRAYLTPEDIQFVFRETVAHRIFFTPVYEMRREAIAGELIGQIVQKVAAP